MIYTLMQERQFPKRWRLLACERSDESKRKFSCGSQNR